jgi:hypothetical protein
LASYPGGCKRKNKINEDEGYPQGVYMRRIRKENSIEPFWDLRRGCDKNGQKDKSLKEL